MKKSRLLGVVFAAIISVGVFFSGCGSNPLFILRDPTPAENITRLSFIGYKADILDLAPIEDTLHDFMDANPNVHVTYEGLKLDDYLYVFKRRMNRNDLDDIFMVNQPYALELIKRDMLADLSDLAVKDDYHDFAKSQFTGDNGRVNFLPLCLSSFGLYVNYDLLNKHNIKIPTNFEEFKKACEYFTSKNITPIVANNKATLRTIVVVKGMYDVYNGTTPSEQRIANFNANPKLIVSPLTNGFQFVEQMLQNNWIDPKEALATDRLSIRGYDSATGKTGDLYLFAQGDRPFMMVGAWASQKIKALNPNLNFGIHPYPLFDDGGVVLTDVSMCIAVKKDSKNLQLAKKFVEHICKPEYMYKIYNSQSSFPPIVGGKNPEDKTISDIEKGINDRRIVIGSNYKLNIPLEDAVGEATIKMLSGATLQEAIKEFEAYIGV